MKLRNLFFVTAAMAGLFSACSNEMDNAIDNGNGEQTKAEAYASISFTMPAGAVTRADAQVTPGTSAENNINEVYFLLYKDGKLAQAPVKRERADFAPGSAAGGAEVYTLKKEKNIPISTAGTYNVHVVVNPATTLTTITEGSNISVYENLVEQVAAKTGAYCTDNKFMMTNANNTVQAVVTKEHNINNALSITIPVERLAAKMTFKSNGAIDLGENGAFGKITFDAYKVINTRNSAYDLRRVGTTQANAVIGAAEANYVVENWFDEKNKGWNEAVWSPNYSRKMNTYVGFRKLDNKNAAQPIAYCLENTIKESENLAKGYTTGVILRGKLDLKEGIIQGTKPATDFDGTFYKFRGVYYYTLSDIKTAFANEDVLKYNSFKKPEDTDEAKYITRISNQRNELYDNLGIELFTKGYCYYYYWVRHNNGTDAAKAEPMEYVIVRNNVYQLAIKSVSGIGSFESGTPGPADPSQPEVEPDNDPANPNPEIPGELAPDQEPEIPAIPVQPDEPVIDNNMYLNVEITVNPWTIRNNDIEL